MGSVAVSHEAVQTAASLSASTPRKSALRRKLHAARVAARRYRQRLQSLRRSAYLRRSDKRPVTNVTELVKAASEFLSGDCLTLFRSQLHFSKVAPKGRRYCSDAKLLALSLYSYVLKHIGFYHRCLLCLADQRCLCGCSPYRSCPGFPGSFCRRLPTSVDVYNLETVCAF